MDHELAMLDCVDAVLGIDEVGRGALAGPVAVGLTLVRRATGPVPVGLVDSKMLTAARRQAMSPLVEAWADGAVGWAEASEVDALGILPALGLAAARGLSSLDGLVAGETVGILLDGNLNWLGDAAFTRFNVETKVKADMTCASVAASSVRAKVARDHLMRELGAQFPGYGWEQNAGYGTKSHRRAIAELGATDLHRRSWKLL